MKKELIAKIKAQTNFAYDGEISFNIASHPFTRRFIVAICENKGLKWSYKRVNKRFVEFTVEAKPEFEEIVKAMIVKIDSKLPNSPEKSLFVNRLIFDLGGHKLLGQVGMAIEEFVVAKKLEERQVTTEPEVQEKVEVELCCPSCFSKSFIKNGKNAKKQQKYKCKDCSHNFVEEA